MPAQLPPFPQLLNAPPLNLSNPAVGAASSAAGDASGAYAAGLHFATALRAAAQQQAQQQQQAADKAKLDLANQQFKLRNIGGTMADGGYGVVPGTQSPTQTGGQLPGLKTRPGSTPADPVDQSDNRIKTAPGGPPIGPGGSASPAEDDPGHYQTDMAGNRWHVPSLEERAIAKQKGKPQDGTFVPAGQLAAALEAAGQDPSKPISFKEAHTLMQAIGLAQPAADESLHIDTEHFSEPITIGTKSGKVSRATLPDGITHNEPTPKADSQTILPDRIGPNGGMLVYDKNQQKTIEIPMPAGTRTQLDPARQAVADRAAEGRQERLDRQDRSDRREQQAARDRAQKLVDQLQFKEDEQHNLRSAYGDILKQYGEAEAADKGSGDRLQVIDPRTGKQETMSAARWRDYTNRYNDATQKARDHFSAKQKLVARHGGETAPTAPAAAQQAAPDPRKQYVQGERYGGKVYLGGNPNSPQSWK